MLICGLSADQTVSVQTLGWTLQWLLFLRKEETVLRERLCARGLVDGVEWTDDIELGKPVKVLLAY
jgi:hypothetical protein